VWKALLKSSVSLPPGTLLMLPAARLLRLPLRLRLPVAPVVRRMLAFFLRVLFLEGMPWLLFATAVEALEAERSMPAPCVPLAAVVGRLAASKSSWNWPPNPCCPIDWPSGEVMLAEGFPVAKSATPLPFP
jgi:hypothetical protein